MPHHLTELEQTLAEDSQGVARDRLHSQLAKERSSLRKQLQSGCTPADFVRLQALLQAVDACVEVIDLIWVLNHGSPGSVKTAMGSNQLA